MSDPALGLTMLMLIVVVIVMGFPTAFTLMGLGMFFGFYAFYNPAEHWLDNRVFDLMVQRTYGAMTNDVLISIPLFVLMGYVMERGALVDKMFYSIQLSFRRVPASLAVATLIVCTFWGIASGLVGAVVVLMGVIAMNPMLRAGYDVKLASGVITAGGTLGILIPPSVMIIVYAAVAGQSVVKLYAAAMFPGFFLAFLYLVYILAWATINPKIAPPLPEHQTKVPVPGWMRSFGAAYSPNMLIGFLSALFSPARALALETGGGRLTYWKLLKNSAATLVPFGLTSLVLGARVVVRGHPSASDDARRSASRTGAAGRSRSGGTRSTCGGCRIADRFLHDFRHCRRARRGRARPLLPEHDCRAARGREASHLLRHAAGHTHRRRARASSCSGSRRRRSSPPSALPAPSCWRFRPERSTGSVPRKRCS